MLSKAQISLVNEKVDLAWKHLKLPKVMKKEFKLTMASYLEKTWSIENVCHECLGSGLKDNKNTLKISIKNSTEE